MPEAGMQQLEDTVSENAKHEARELAACGLGLGLCADLLVWAERPAETGFALWVLLLAVCVGSLARLRKTLNLPRILAWSAVAFVAAAVMVVRRSELLNLAMVGLLLVASSMVLLLQTSVKLYLVRLGTCFWAALQTGLHCLFGSVQVLMDARLREAVNNPRWYQFLRSILILIPLLLLFLALFSSADAVFDRFTTNALQWISEDLIAHIIRLFIFIWVAIGLLAALARTRANAGSLALPPLQLAPIETNIILGGLVALFVAFVLLQMGYLFGGRDLIEATTELTLAEYARRGFFELLVVAGLTLVLLLFLAPGCSHQKIFRRLAGVLIGCVLLMQLSAVQRLHLYMAEFGLTFDRVVASAVLLWLCYVLILFCCSVLREKPEGFVLRSIEAGVLLALALALLNPAALVTRVNISRSVNSNTLLDHNYLLQLGPDAIPALLDRFELLSTRARCSIAVYTALGTYEPFSRDWRHFNLALWRAEQAVSARKESLEAILVELRGRLEPEQDDNNLLALCDASPA